MTTYRLVPVEPSEDMKRALATKIKTYCPEAPSYDMAHDLYETMLASAPVKQNELLEAAKEAHNILADLARPTSMVSGSEVVNAWARCVETELKLRLAIRNAEQAKGTPTP